MKLAIMQPYFLPYIGYFQLMNAVDEFVVYDNIQFTKKGWINRNRILVNGQDSFMTIPLKKDSDYLDVKDRLLADKWQSDRLKMLNRIKESYRRAPQFGTVYPLVEKTLFFEKTNLFDFILNSLIFVKNYLGIQTSLVVSSTIDIDPHLKAEQRVIAICRARKADAYINPIGGVSLYAKDHFSQEGINLSFLKSDEITYTQFGSSFAPWLSILDIMMFNTREIIAAMLDQYTLW